MQSDQFREYFVNWKQSWYFPERDETEQLLQKTRFKDIQVNLLKLTTTFSGRESFAIFSRIVIMNTFLDYLPDVKKKKDQFVNAFLMEFEHSEGAWSLGFMRLSIFARKF